MNDSISSYNLPNAELALLSKGKRTTFNFFLAFLKQNSPSGNFHTIADLLLASTQDAAKRCRSSPVEVKRVIEKVLNSVPLFTLKHLDTLPDEIFTTGDELLDRALGGGIRTGMVWEVVGERYLRPGF